VWVGVVMCLLGRQAASEGDTGDTVAVTVNGESIGTFHNDHDSGFPCSSSGDCLNEAGLYVAWTEIEGASIEYTVTWSSANTDPDKHMVLGEGEAVFLGAAAPPPRGDSWSHEVTMTAKSAMDANKLALGTRTSDGFQSRAFRIAQAARLVVLDGLTAVAETVMESGEVEIAVPLAETYTCVVTLPGYFHFYDDDCSSASGNHNYALMSPIMPPGMARIVLQWGAQPRDLDVYLLAPHRDPADPPCMLNYRQTRCHSGTVHLDKDDTSGHGPETITIRHFNHGQYVLHIDEYGGSDSNPSWDMSHAMVTYYAPHLGAVQYHVGRDGYTVGKKWYVMMVDGETRNPVECRPGENGEVCVAGEGGSGSGSGTGSGAGSGAAVEGGGCCDCVRSSCNNGNGHGNCDQSGSRGASCAAFDCNAFCLHASAPAPSPPPGVLTNSAGVCSPHQLRDFPAFACVERFLGSRVFCLI